MGVRNRHPVVALLGLRQRLLRGQQPGIARHHEIGGAFVGLGHRLLDLRDATRQQPRRRHLEVAGIGMQFVGQEREQRALAGAVAADESDLLAGIEGGRCALQDDLDAAAQGEVLEDDHVRSVKSSAARGARG
jgi:hypothetical protein